MSDTFRHSHIRSFVLRQGRLTPAQQKAIAEYWPEYGLDYQPEPLELDKVFGRSAPKVLEIGAGMGENIVAMAHSHPENDYLVVEVHKPGIGKLIRQAVKLNLSNIRIINHDAVEVLSNQIQDNSLSQVLIFFPDPWPKKRHHKRRLIQARFISELSRRMLEHGRIFIATDWQDMAEHILAFCEQESSLINLAGAGKFAPRPRWRPVTRFEARGKNLKHGIWDLIYGINRSPAG